MAFWAGLAAGPARAADCLLLDAPELEKARTEGRCQDVFARSAPAAKEAPAKPAKPAKAPRRTKAKTKAQPSLATTLEQLFNRVTTEPPVTVRRRGGVDHLSYGRTEPNPVER
ncbi:hypothetical protein [Azospirillum sp. TSO22-1]|uniref:hypothetical protein n=1 Tax=Azospirillum sp. TSO22-1 TaxID=716789 RepID=UPI0011B43ABD|nr:hypothetical protein [Azospirillum sp. TSO22-1]